MKVKRKCQNCNKSDHMMRVIDKKQGFYDVRHRICYRCHPELDSGSHLNGPGGGLRMMKNEHRDSRWDYCEPLPKFVDTEPEDVYLNEDTVVGEIEVEN